MERTVEEILRENFVLNEILEEIKSICVGAFSPDAQENGKKNPKDELKKCLEDLQRISDIAEELTTNQTKGKI